MIDGCVSALGSALGSHGVAQGDPAAFGISQGFLLPPSPAVRESNVNCV